MIKDFRFDISISASIFEIHILVVNINSRKIVPDISRNNFDYDGRKNINYIIGKAIHFDANKALDLIDDERDTLIKFTEHFILRYLISRNNKFKPEIILCEIWVVM